MAENSKIEWTDHTFNPWRGCAVVHEGCANCYAWRESKRFPAIRGVWGPNGTRVVASDDMWRQPLKWNKKAEQAKTRARVFCASLADVFEDWQGRMHSHNEKELWSSTGSFTVEEDDGSKDFAFERQPLTMADCRRRLFELIDKTPWLDWQLVTKRPENVRRMWDYSRKIKGHICQNEGDGIDAYRKNVWLLTSVSNQKTADAMIPELLKCRDLVPVLGLSAEPLLGPIDLSDFLYYTNRERETRSAKLDWVIVGGESGPAARPCDPNWVRSLRDQCRSADIPFFFKQWGNWQPVEPMADEFPTCGPVPENSDNKSMRLHDFDDYRYAVFLHDKYDAGRTIDGNIFGEFPK